MLGLPYHINEIATVAGALDLFQGLLDSPPIKYISFDSRTISHGSETLFVALKTPNRDGHEFISDAYEKGVRNFLTEQKLSYSDCNYAHCDDCLDTLQRWAYHHRQRFSYPVIGITGSNGKTVVKEWLATLLEMHMQVVKSPMSYNSQLGVALSLLRMHPQADIAIIEAGISQKDEMGRLWLMIQPDIGILTHMGSSHASGFSSESEKLGEKLQLFEGVDQVLVGSKQEKVLDALEQAGLAFRTSKEIQEALPATIQTDADKENIKLCLLAVKHLGIDLAEIWDRIPLLHPVEMRTQWITDNPDITLINDSYNSDEDSVRNALQVLLNDPSHTKKQIILSDIPSLGNRQTDVHTAILEETCQSLGKEHVYTIGPIFKALGHPQSYLNTKELLASLQYARFKHSTLLLKGARRFELEQLIPFFNKKLNATYFKIRLHQLAQNYRSLKSRLPQGTHTMCMVKAGSYGSGTWQIAQVLEEEGAAYLAVAYASEGIELRQSRIRLPIMVMNPDLSSIESLLQFGIEPEVSNFDFLEKFLRAARLSGLKSYRIHLKLETGMGRLGFSASELPRLINILNTYPDLEIVSVMSHLAAADDPNEDAFSFAQIERFQDMHQTLQAELGIASFRHILNTAGLLRFPQFAFEMVRLGIGLYGIDPLEQSGEQAKIEEIGSLHSSISQIRAYPEGLSIGYGRTQKTQRPSRIATVAIGYADGIPRSVGNGKASFLVHGQPAPTFGRICMDMLMLDVTDIPEAEAGDPVLIFGRDQEHYLSIKALSKAADTIPYEILVRLSVRIRRIYERE